MIELNAFLYQDSGHSISPTESEVYLKACASADTHYFVEHHVGNLAMVVSGDHPVDDCIHKSSSTSLICQADIWNAGELRNQIVGGGETTAALLGKLYEAHGETFVLLLQGSFSIILYDHLNHLIRAYADPFGVRSLAFSQSGDKLALATDLRRLIKAGVTTPSIDPTAILEYLQYSCIPAPHTIYHNIQRLEPGHQLVNRPTLRSLPYWDMSFKEDAGSRRSEEEWAAATMAEVQKAVVKSIVGQGPQTQVGCFLSGGTDSTSVTGLLGKLTGVPARSFSIGFDDPRYNEIEYARIAARHHRTDHSEYFVTPRDILELLPRASSVYDEPFGNSSIVPTYYCARLAKGKGITHMLAGDGGDELFGGNERYVSDHAFQRYQRIPAWGRKLFVEPAISVSAATMGNLKLLEKASRYIRRANIGLPDRIFSYSFISSFPREELFSPGFLVSCNGHDPLETARRHYQAAPTSSPLNRWLYLDLKMIISDNDIRKVTRMADLAGISVRYPLLSSELAEFSGTIPASLKVKGNQLRYLFKKAMNSVLPPEIIKKKKHGFGLPYSVWLGEYTPLKDFTFDLLGSSRCRQRGYFRKDLLEYLWNGYINDDRKYFGDVVCVFMLLELWHSQQHD